MQENHADQAKQRRVGVFVFVGSNKVVIPRDGVWAKAKSVRNDRLQMAAQSLPPNRRFADNRSRSRSQ